VSGKRDHPEKVCPVLARQALAETDQRTHVWTHYILAHYHSTGNLAPGCDARDLYAWLETNEATALAAITHQPDTTRAPHGARRRAAPDAEATLAGDVHPAQPALFGVKEG